MKVVGVIGYGSSGASFVTDYLREFDNVSTLPKEFYLIEEPDGIESLKYALVYSKSRVLSHAAIKRFLKNIKSKGHILFLKTNKKLFVRYCKEYVDSLVVAQWNGFSTIDPKDIRKANNFSLNNRILNKICSCFKIKKSFPRSKKRFFSVLDEQTFNDKTKVFLMNIFDLMGLTKDIVVLEQLFPCLDPQKCFCYFDEPYCIKVERDIRDVYIETNYVIPHQSRFMPCQKDEDAFINFYKALNTVENKQNCQNVLNLKFEDLVLKYDSETAKIKNLLNLDENHHVKKHKYANPNVSCKNVGIYKKYPHLEEFYVKCRKCLPELIYEKQD